MDNMDDKSLLSVVEGGDVDEMKKLITLIDTSDSGDASDGSDGGGDGEDSDGLCSTPAGRAGLTEGTIARWMAMTTDELSAETTTILAAVRESGLAQLRSVFGHLLPLMLRCVDGSAPAVYRAGWACLASALPRISPTALAWHAPLLRETLERGLVAADKMSGMLALDAAAALVAGLPASSDDALDWARTLHLRMMASLMRTSEPALRAAQLRAWGAALTALPAPDVVATLEQTLALLQGCIRADQPAPALVALDVLDSIVWPVAWPRMTRHMDRIFTTLLHAYVSHVADGDDNGEAAHLCAALHASFAQSLARFDAIDHAATTSYTADLYEMLVRDVDVATEASALVDLLAELASPDS
ncbi:uncharacterized protein AMSG_00790 [Thecamonas trahens ATCC 50062]|uniref:Uncharacterized protein n=1 Tax=Thecamonas trahens ATCC 50062 TaxID=461836 RepID=A0A0L0DH47_THETB|nr:hypothetical protein AMSG_00790 [Thecamonas trahens ATCC 50062]KNC50628.1 hypothetical protein AMSG_00790 [Thecamonas trahens ATCC 50062]|eukprot:XP_013762514.1 hypothetical protein AMSG_00790 [Thecamonas trahens ATCC 50062]